MSGTSQPKASMRTKLPNGDFLTLTVWAGKTDPNAEVITVQIRHLQGDQWKPLEDLLPTEPATEPTRSYPNAHLHQNQSKSHLPLSHLFSKLR